jgi:beta-N-acetylhexosaminidase
MSTAVLRRIAAQLFMVGIPGPTLDEETQRFLAEYPVGGVILFRRNVESGTQLRRLVSAIHKTGAGPTPLVGIDHEGGRVHRLPKPFTHFPPALSVAATRSVRTARAAGLAMGRELAAVGIDIDFAPVLDVWSNPRNRVIGDRAFGHDPVQAARMALAVAAGLEAGGVLPCGKHFPGHGDTVGDSHLVRPRVRKSRAELERLELIPFRRAIRAGLPALMTAHVLFPALDPRRPATLSPLIARRLLRGRLGFRGTLFSDDLEMRAVAGRQTPGNAAVASLAAGCDMLLVCLSLATARQAIDGVVAALARGRLPTTDVATSLGRIESLRRRLARRRRTAPTRLGWPAHTRLAARIPPLPAV